jgi:hypothetical protein
LFVEVNPYGIGTKKQLKTSTKELNLASLEGELNLIQKIINLFWIQKTLLFQALLLDRNFGSFGNTPNDPIIHLIPPTEISERLE